MNCVLETLATTVSGAESKTFSNSTLFRFTWHHDLSVCLRPSLNRPQQSASTIGLNNLPQLQKSVAVAPVVVVPVTVVVAAVVDAKVAAAVVVAVVVINVVVAISKV